MIKVCHNSWKSPKTWQKPRNRNIVDDGRVLQSQASSQFLGLQIGKFLQFKKELMDILCRITDGLEANVTTFKKHTRTNWTQPLNKRKTKTAKFKSNIANLKSRIFNLPLFITTYFLKKIHVSLFYFFIFPNNSGLLPNWSVSSNKTSNRSVHLFLKFWRLFLQLITIRIYLKTKKEMFNSKKKGIKKMLVLDNFKYVTNIKATLHMNWSWYYFRFLCQVLRITNTRFK